MRKYPDLLNAVYLTSLLVLAVSLLLPGTAKAFADNKSTDSDQPPEVKAVINYLLNDEYPELFDNKPYHIRPTGYAVGDLDGDGVDEVVMSFYPHYLQSPTILIFRVNKKMKVTRVTEGLAPGPLLPNSGDYLDSHTMGKAADFEMDKKSRKDPKKRAVLVKSFLKQHGNIVEYRNFYHFDGREGKPTYIDMKNIDNPPKDGTCVHIEFSRVDDVKIVYKKGEKAGYLAALVGDSVYLYKINKFRSDGLMDKSLQILPMDTN